MYSVGFFSDPPCARLARNSALQPSDTQIPVSSYPHVFPSRHGAVPVDFSSATPLEVSAAQCRRSPACDWHETRSSFRPAGAAACGTLGVGTSVVAASAAGGGVWTSE